jgi:uncharacterized UPF0146 family protein
MEISYGHLTSAWDGYSEWLRILIRRVQPKHVLEVGAGAKPSIPLSEMADLGIAEYTVLDISETELAKAPTGYKTICADISSESLALTGQYDLIFSRMLAEHVRTPGTFHRNIYSLLSPRGKAFHFYATMFCPVYVLNRIMPEWLSWKLVSFADPNRTKHGDNDKFPAYYRWCYGPVGWQIRRFEQLGYEVETYRGFFGHGYYNRIPVLREAHNWLTAHLLKRPNPYLTTVAYLVLRKPEKRKL